MRLSVIIPVFNLIEMTKDLLVMISNNTIKPTEIFIIDDAGVDDYKTLVDKYTSLDIFDIHYIRNKENMGTNACWNIGVSKATGDLISILNNDIIINLKFFEHIFDTMKDESISICVPRNVGLGEKINDDSRKILSPLTKREGWAWTIRANLARQFFPIPPELRTFFGDDYIFEHVSRAGKIVKMEHNRIVHLKTTTMGTFWDKAKIKQTIGAERIEYNKIMRGKWDFIPKKQ
jgi:glycosyltransferase involved in cell wall biosynthesis